MTGTRNDSRLVSRWPPGDQPPGDQPPGEAKPRPVYETGGDHGKKASGAGIDGRPEADAGDDSPATAAAPLTPPAPPVYGANGVMAAPALRRRRRKIASLTAALARTIGVRGTGSDGAAGVEGAGTDMDADVGMEATASAGDGSRALRGVDACGGSGGSEDDDEMTGVLRDEAGGDDNANDEVSRESASTAAPNVAPGDEATSAADARTASGDIALNAVAGVGVELCESVGGVLEAWLVASESTVVASANEPTRECAPPRVEDIDDASLGIGGDAGGGRGGGGAGEFSVAAVSAAAPETVIPAGANGRRMRLGIGAASASMVEAARATDDLGATSRPVDRPDGASNGGAE